MPEYKCQLPPRIAEAARRLIDQSNVDERASLRSFIFEREDPLGAFSDEVVKTAQVVAKQASIHFRTCRNVDAINNLLLSDVRWSARLIINAAAQILRGERFNANEVLVAFHVGSLNERATVDSPPETCAHQSGPFSADFNADPLQRWYRWRVISWVECKGSSIQVYFPESGWSVASPAHVRAIRTSNPGWKIGNEETSK